MWIRRWVESKTIPLSRGVDGWISFPSYFVWLRVRFNEGPYWETWLFIKTPVFVIRTDPEVIGRGWHQLVIKRDPRGWRTFWKRVGPLKQVTLDKYVAHRWFEISRR